MDEYDLFYTDVGRRIRKARINIGLTQEALASLVNLTRTSIVNIEKGRQKILLHTLIEIAAALQSPAVELLPSSTSSSSLELDILLNGHSKQEMEWVKSALGKLQKDSKNGR